jgi:hypothetical protein
MMDEVAGQPIEMKDAEPLVFGSNLLWPWVIANFVAFTIGFGVGGGVLDSIVRPHFGTNLPALEAARIQATGAGLGALVEASFVAVAQWLVLRRAIRAGWWIPATLAGIVPAAVLTGLSSGGSVSTIGPAAGPVPPLLSIFIVTPLIILLPGAGQWLVLRRDCARVAWWPLVSIGAFAGAGFAGLTIAKLLPWIAGTHYPSAQALTVVGMVAGPIYGYLTWQFLAQLRRRSASPEVA